jgi:hypothetical protein
VSGGGRAPTTVRLHAGHEGRHTSSPELRVDSEEKKSGSAAAFPRRGGATVAGGGPATARRERRVSSSSTGEERRGEAVRRRSPWRNSRRRRRQQRQRLGSDSGAWHLRTGARGHGWSGRRRRTRGSRRGRAGEWRCRNGGRGAVGTAFKPPRACPDSRPRQPIRAWHGATLPLTGGPHASVES